MKKNNYIIGTCLFGWAGSGKTYMASKLANILKIEAILEGRNYVFMQDFGNIQIKDYYKTKEKLELIPLKIAIKKQISFISDLHFGSIYYTFNQLYQNKESCFELLANRIKRKTPENVSILGLEISLEQTEENIRKRSEQDWKILKPLAKIMIPLMNGFLEYCDGNLTNFEVIDTSSYNPFDEDKFIKENHLWLPNGGLENVLQ